MTIEEAREYWSRRLERAEGYSDEHWDAEERHAHADYIDALKCAITALAICREHEETWKPKTNGDKIRAMNDEELAELYEEYADCRMCIYSPHNCKSECVDGYTKWLKQEVQDDAGD